jgi:hypothetical protein
MTVEVVLDWLAPTTLLHIHKFHPDLAPRFRREEMKKCSRNYWETLIIKIIVGIWKWADEYFKG